VIIGIRIFSGILVSLPAVLVGACAYTQIGDEYYRPSYLIACTAFIAASFVFGLFLSPRPQETPFGRAWISLFMGGAIAWILALAVLGMVNLTPLCVGQDNGDGINSLGMCVGYTMIATAVYSPLVLTLLAVNAAVGGAIMGARKVQN
jgi:hypothetical protein